MAKVLLVSAPVKLVFHFTIYVSVVDITTIQVDYNLVLFKYKSILYFVTACLNLRYYCPIQSTFSQHLQVFAQKKSPSTFWDLNIHLTNFLFPSASSICMWQCEKPKCVSLLERCWQMWFTNGNSFILIFVWITWTQQSTCLSTMGLFVVVFGGNSFHTKDHVLAIQISLNGIFFY